MPTPSTLELIEGCHFLSKMTNKKVKLSLQQAVEAHRVMRCRGSQTVLDSLQVAVRLSALHAGRALPPGRSLVVNMLETELYCGLKN
jgi:hypothetical protein